MSLIHLLILCLIPTTEAHCVLHCPQPGYVLKLEGVRRINGQLVALWSAQWGPGESGVWRKTASVLVPTTEPVRCLVQGVNWGWWKVGDTRAVESLGDEAREKFAREWTNAEPMRHREAK